MRSLVRGILQRRAEEESHGLARLADDPDVGVLSGAREAGVEGAGNDPAQVVEKIVKNNKSQLSLVLRVTILGFLVTYKICSPRSYTTRGI